MDDRSRLGLVFIGILLLIGALGYFIYNQRVNLASKKTAALPSVKTIAPAKVSPSPSPVVKMSPSPSPAGQALGTTTKGGNVLPKTGAPEVMLAIVYSSSAVIAGWGLRKFPN